MTQKIKKVDCKRRELCYNKKRENFHSFLMFFCANILFFVICSQYVVKNDRGGGFK